MHELNIGKIILIKRREKGITQDDLAEYIGVSKASVSKWETAQSYPDITFLPKIASYFNISIDELIDYQPQMKQEEISKLYQRLAKEFAEKLFDDVMCEVEAITQRYYSCFPLLYSMGTLLTNHYMLAEEDKHQEVLLKAIHLLKRVKSESQDVALTRSSNSMEAVCYLFLSQPEQMIELLENEDTAAQNDKGLLALGYSMNNQQDKAIETLQFDIFQTILNLIQNLQTLLSLEAAESARMKEIMKRIQSIADVFGLEQLHPAIMLQVYLSQAAAEIKHNNTNAALLALQKYCDLSVSNIYPITLHGDHFFNKINIYLTKHDLNSNAPRSEKTIKQGIADAVTKNPVFAPLAETSQFKSIAEKLTTI